jgi:four helix bundle protein
MHDYKQLALWKKSMVLVNDIYNILNYFPDFEKFALSNQIRRSVISIPSNIAEGAGRLSNNEFKLFLGYANGSCYELDTQLLIAFNQKYLSEETFMQLEEKVKDIQKMNYKLIKSIQ